MLETIRLAAYLDDAGEDPVSACKTLNGLNIHYTVLRQAWTNDVADLSDRGCKKLRETLISSNISPIALITTLGEVPALELAAITKPEIEKMFNLAAYFKTPIIRIQIGTKVQQDAAAIIDEWLDKIKQYAIAYNVTPVFEITSDSYYKTPSEVAVVLSKHKRWRLLYDPVQLILKQLQDPFIKFWSLLKGSVAAIDVCDFKIGRGFKPAGFGDSKILLTISDAINTRYNGWFFLGPGLGRRYGSFITRHDTFTMAYQAFESSLQSKLGVENGKHE